MADWAFRQGQPAGLATATLAAQPWHYVPLQAPMRVRGVLALSPAQPRWLLIPEQAQQLDTLARQIAIALERVHYVEVAQQAVVEMESERLRNALLGAISHDVRTPLTALIALAESLQTLPPDGARRGRARHRRAGAPAARAGQQPAGHGAARKRHCRRRGEPAARLAVGGRGRRVGDPRGANRRWAACMCRRCCRSTCRWSSSMPC